jgi:2',3'-cyclic-nucleotide 2'-phosphodiesterase (5'-nucleotidase family)
MMTRRLIHLALLLPAALGLSAACAAPEPGPGPYNLTLFHTNDIHSQVFPRPASWRDDGRMVGGIVPLAWHLADQRRSAAADLLLDAGDFMTGNPVCNLREDGVPGAAVARLMNHIGYDAGLIGNHEFDVGLADLQRLAPRFGYPLLAADLLDADGRPLFRAEPLVFERGGLRVGVLGVSCAELDEVVAPSRLAGMVMADQVAVVRRQAAALDPDTDLLVLLSHNGIDADRRLAAAVADAGIDVIVGGHSHTRLKEPEIVDGVLIVQAGSYLTNLGRLDLQVEDDRVVRYAGRLVELWSDGTFGPDELNALAASYERTLHEKYGRKLGELAGPLEKGRGEHDIGNWLADVLREAAGADVGVINSGGIRRSLAAGPVTAMDIQQLLPFANTLVTVDMSGAELRAVVQQNADAGVDGSHGILQVSGVAYRYHAADDGKAAVLEQVLVGGAPLDDGARYAVAMPDFVALMAHVYLGRDVPPMDDTGMVLSEVVVQAIEQAGAVAVPAAGRIVRTDQETR